MTERENEMTAMNTSGKRQIKASEVKPGMTIRWTDSGITQECTVGSIINRYSNSVVGITTPEDTIAYVRCAYPVTVLSEPQPVEPRWIAARAKVGDRRFFRVDESDRPWRKADCMGRVFLYRYSWSDICALGPVTVIPDQGWAVPAEPTPEVPEKLYEWPTCDEHLRGHKWRDDDGDTVQYIDGAWRYLWSFGPGNAHTAPLECVPWTRIDEVPEKLYIWPICDEHLRGHKWCDSDGDTIQYVDGAWRYLWPYGPGCARTAPLERGPWTRKDD